MQITIRLVVAACHHAGYQQDSGMPDNKAVHLRFVEGFCADGPDWHCSLGLRRTLTLKLATDLERAPRHIFENGNKKREWRG